MPTCCAPRACRFMKRSQTRPIFLEIGHFVMLPERTISGITFKPGVFPSFEAQLSKLSRCDQRKLTAGAVSRGVGIQQVWFEDRGKAVVPALACRRGGRQ